MHAINACEAQLTRKVWLTRNALLGRSPRNDSQTPAQRFDEPLSHWRIFNHCTQCDKEAMDILFLIPIKAARQQVKLGRACSIEMTPVRTEGFFGNFKRRRIIAGADEGFNPVFISGGEFGLDLGLADPHGLKNLGIDLLDTIQWIGQFRPAGTGRSLRGEFAITLLAPPAQRYLIGMNPVLDDDLRDAGTAEMLRNSQREIVVVGLSHDGAI